MEEELLQQSEIIANVSRKMGKRKNEKKNNMKKKGKNSVKIHNKWAISYNKSKGSMIKSRETTCKQDVQEMLRGEAPFQFEMSGKMIALKWVGQRYVDKYWRKSSKK